MKHPDERPDEDQIDLALAALPAPELDERFSARVLAMARGELAPAEPQSATARLRLAVRGALVPALLTSAAGCRTALTVETAKVVFRPEAAETSPAEPPSQEPPAKVP